jgi:hypothetical protein
MNTRIGLRKTADKRRIIHMTKIAIVKHNGSQTPYTFYTDIDLEKDDLVVCDTQKGYETGRVLRVTESIQGVSLQDGLCPR